MMSKVDNNTDVMVDFKKLYEIKRNVSNDLLNAKLSFLYFTNKRPITSLEIADPFLYVEIY